MKPSETLESLMTFGFSVSVFILNLLFIVGWFECFFGVFY